MEERDEESGRFVCDFVERLPTTDTGKPFRLYEWQRETLMEFYSTMERDEESGRLLRKYQYLYLEIPKKNGKSELSAALGLYHLFGDGELNAEVYLCAADKDNAGIVFRAAVFMLETAPWTAKMIARGELKVVRSQKRIEYRRRVKAENGGLRWVTVGLMQVLSSESYSKHGYKPSCVIFDELHAQPDRKLWDVMTGAAGAAHDQHVQVAVEFGVELGAVQGEAEVLREDEVVVLRGEVAELLALFERAPSCRTALLTGAEVAHEGEVAQPKEPDDDAHGQARQHGIGGHVEMGGCIGDKGPHEGETISPVLEELPAEGRHRLPIAIAKIETYDGDQKRHQSRGRDLLVDFRVSLALSHKRPSFLALASRQGAGERDGDGGAGGRRGALREALVTPETKIVLGSDAVGVAGAGAVVALKRRRLPAHGDAVRADDALAARLYLVEQVPEVGGG